MGPLHAGQETDAGPASTRLARAPHVGQNAEPSNIIAKHRGQLTVASPARQYGHRVACGSAAAPQLGQ
jgi:hypothetical protein